ncbi:tetratricopeptide repeat protein [Nodosilinea sp. E11]|uniref:tetratricopeptide repeat protein n=1 Tax=Nodosilinea sp. E11 TaxID=3037479 RepID=UPI002934BE82|nr:tetratricopeptide repeat protein [Nodosilinea sp. E11]WOD38083.1 tetratricopeptide repeat protein [Nodosilinea sp. E11]
MTTPRPALEDGGLAATPLESLIASPLGGDLGASCPHRLADLLALDLSSPWVYGHYMAIVQWLSHYEPHSQAPLDQVRGWLEAFYHACEAELWPIAWAIATAPVGDGTALYRQLGLWGHRREQVELCEALLDQVDPGLPTHGLQNELRQLAGHGWQQLGAYDKARHHYDKLLADSRAQPNLRLEVEARCGLADLEMEYMRYRAVINELEAVLPQAQALAAWETTAKVLQQLALAYGYTGRTRRSLEVLQEALTLAQTHRLSAQETATLHHFAKVYEWRGEPEQALPYLNRCLALGQAQNNLILQADILVGLCRCSFLSRDLEAAIAHGQQSLALYREIYCCNREALVLNDLGVIYAYGLSHCAEAIAYFNQAESVARRIGEGNGMIAIIMAHQAYCYAALGQYHQAQQASQRALATVEAEAAEAYIKAIVYACVAKVHWEQRDYGPALTLVYRALRLSPPWQTSNGRLLFRKVWDTLTRPFAHWRSRGVARLKKPP